MVLEVLEETVEDLSLLLDKEVLEDVVLLLDQELLHNFIEISAKNGEGILIDVKEGGEGVQEGEIEALDGLDWFWGCFLVLLAESTKFSLVGFAGL